MKKVIVYDFDKTLTKNDTLLNFFLFNEKKNFIFYIKFTLYLILMILAKVKIISNHKLKDLGIKLFLKKLNYNELQYKFLNYKEKIKYNFLYGKTDFTRDDIYIVSASFKEYLEPIFPSNVKILASSIKYKNTKAVGLQFNCYGDNKIQLLKNEKIEFINIFYTDSISDLPLVEISKEIILIKDNIEIKCDSIDDFIKKVQK